VWEFFGTVLEKAGFVALLFFAFGVFVVHSIRALWAQNQELHAQIATNHREHVSAMTLIQERRIEDAHKVADRLIEHSSKLEKTADRLVGKLDTMIQIGKGRG
jgi:ABC-type multidrug transport system fused ATPase/permease subunit